jgi:hypothetical protein
MALVKLQKLKPMTTFHHPLFRSFFLLLLSHFPALLPAQQQQQQQQCSVNINNDPATCAALLQTTQQDCDCYVFCNGQVMQCAPFHQSQYFQCVGSIVAGCTQDTSTTTRADSESTPTTPSECAVTINAQDAVCQAYYDYAQEESCDCSNYCNGKRTGCFVFGERTSFTCSGDTVAGCTVSQTQGKGGGSGRTTKHSGAWSSSWQRAAVLLGIMVGLWLVI